MTTTMQTGIIPRATIAILTGHRARAIELFRQAEQFAAAAQEAAAKAAPNAASYRVAKCALSDGAYRNRTISADDWRKDLDRGCWHSALGVSGIEALMGAKQRERFREQIEKDPPEFTEETVEATLRDLAGRSGEIFEESVIEIFNRLPRRYRSHDGFKIGARLIAEYAVSHWGGSFNWYYASYGTKRDTVDDLERIMLILDGKMPDPQTHRGKSSDAAGEAMKKGETEIETEYFRMRWFQNGNLHIWFLRDDLVRSMNRIIAKHFGARIGETV